jgi:hypothetical protein
MRRSSTSKSVLPADWAEILELGQQTLQTAEAEAAKRAAALEQTVQPPATDPEPAWRGCLGQAQERLANLAVYAERAARDIAAVDAALEAGEETLRHWLAASEAARRKLAEWAGRG